ncbi:MAG: sugar ABC transporter substrate-binding protein [Alphaproteobacteria bacterium]
MKLIKKIIYLLVVTVAIMGSTISMAAEKPAPFDGSKKVHIALIRQLVEGEFMQSYQAGAEKQAKALNIKITTFGKNNDNQAQANFVYQAINLGVDGIIIDHGLTETMAKPAADALAKGIPVVAFDVDLENPEIPQIAQDDHKLGAMALEALKKDYPEGANIGYVYVAGILPLDKRDVSFTKFKEENPIFKEVARTGTFESPFSVKNADQVKAVLTSNPNINAYFAPYDEFGKGVVLALNETGMSDKIGIYTADISTQDIQEMIKQNSPWKATAATNPASIGAVSVRAIAMKIAKQDVPHDILIPPYLFTQNMLREKGVKNMKGLREQFPEFTSVPLLMPDWIKEVQ